MVIFIYHLDILDKHGIVNVTPLSPYEIHRIRRNMIKVILNLVQFELEEDSETSKKTK